MRKLMNGLALLALLLLSGCASLGPKIHTVEERVTESRDWVERTPGDALPVTARWDNGVLRAEVERQINCTPMRDQTVELQGYHQRQVHGLNGQIAASFVMLGIGIAGMVTYGVLAMNEDPYAPEDEFQPSTAAALVGLGGIGLAGYGFVDAFFTHMESRPEKRGVAQSEFRSNPSGAAKRCGAEPAPVSVVVNLPNQPVKREFQDGKIVLDFAGARKLCPAQVIGKEITINWEGAGTRKTLWRGSLDDCAHARIAKEAFAQTRDEIARSEVTTAARHFADGTAAVAKIDSNYFAHAALAEEAEALREVLQVAVLEALDRAIARATAQRNMEFPILHDAATDAIALAAPLADRGPATWAAMYRLLLPAVREPAHLRLLLAEPSVERCLAGECDAMDNAEFLDLMSSAFERGSQSVDASRKRLETAIRKDAISEKLLAIEQVNTDWCANDIRHHIADACEHLFTVRRQAWVEISKREYRVFRGRALNTAKEWRAQFSTCRKVAKGIEAFRGIYSCGADCQRAHKRLLADQTALRNFSPTTTLWETSELEKVRAECRDAGCPRCP